jgi:sensor histidine kinase YesM
MLDKIIVKQVAKGIFFKFICVNLIGFIFGLIVDGLTTFVYWDKYLAYSSTAGLSLWLGNEYLSKCLDRKYSWFEFPIRKLVLRLVVSLTFSTIVITILYLHIWFNVLHRPNLTHFLEYNKFSFLFFYIVTTVIMLVLHTVDFFRSWQVAALNEEKLKKESIALQLQALKNQVDPHFLFNSLNTLTSLIETDSKKAISFVKQLSDMFRYMLNRDSRELIDIDSELGFVKAYIFLQQIRFGENLKIQINIQDSNFYVLPVSLQMLIENAIKHNEVSSEFSLVITIYDDEEYVYVSNTIQPKILETPSKGIGLDNLKTRYSFFTDNKVVIGTDNDIFCVKLPKLNYSDV